jgi:hypothetical protein
MRHRYRRVDGGCFTRGSEDGCPIATVWGDFCVQSWAIEDFLNLKTRHCQGITKCVKCLAIGWNGDEFLKPGDGYFHALIPKNLMSDPTHWSEVVVIA